jgi:hypothetical protein
MAVPGRSDKSTIEASERARCESRKHWFHPFELMIFNGHAERATQGFYIERCQ